jgi:hypothetical protein
LLANLGRRRRRSRIGGCQSSPRATREEGAGQRPASSISATTIIEGFAEGEYPRGLATTHRYLALQLEGADTRNAGRLNHLY